MGKAEEHQVIQIQSYWNTSHECEMCDKSFAGVGAALVTLDNEKDRIICSKCLEIYKEHPEQKHKFTH